MLTEHSIVKVHFCDRQYFPTFRNEIKHRAIDRTFEVKCRRGKLGIDWGDNPVFRPFEAFAWTAVFEAVNTGRLYHYSDLIRGIKEIEQCLDCQI